VLGTVHNGEAAHTAHKVSFLMKLTFWSEIQREEESMGRADRKRDKKTDRTSLSRGGNSLGR
jgi:hypothetical protein